MNDEVVWTDFLSLLEVPFSGLLTRVRTVHLVSAKTKGPTPTDGPTPKDSQSTDGVKKRRDKRVPFSLVITKRFDEVSYIPKSHSGSTPILPLR